MAKYCKNCGAPVDDRMEYCKNCGQPVRVENLSQRKKPGQPQASHRNNSSGGAQGQSRDPYGQVNYQSCDSYGQRNHQSRDPYGRINYSSRDAYGQRDSQPRDAYGRMDNSSRDLYGRTGGQSGKSYGNRSYGESWNPYGQTGGQFQDPYGRINGRSQDSYGNQPWQHSHDENVSKEWEPHPGGEEVPEPEEKKGRRSSSGKKGKSRKTGREKRKVFGRFELPRSVIPLTVVFGVIAVALVVLLVLFAMTLTSDGVDTSSPENIVGSFYEKLEEKDMEGALACFSSEEAAEHFDYEKYVDFYDSEDQDTLLPAQDDKIQLVNQRKLEGRAADQIASTLRVIGLGEDVGEQSAQGVSPWQTLGVELEDYIESVDSGSLKGLIVERVELAVQEKQNQDETQEKLNEEAGVYGADERREYAALFTVGETSYIQGFTLDRYGEDWKIYSLTSELAGTSSYGIPSVAEKSSDFENYIE